jgi:lipoprotein signal peptidase
MGNKGNAIGLLSGLTWAVYTIVLYTILNLYAAAKGDYNNINFTSGFIL